MENIIVNTVGVIVLCILLAMMFIFWPVYKTFVEPLLKSKKERLVANQKEHKRKLKEYEKEYEEMQERSNQKLKEIPLRVVIRTHLNNKTSLESSVIGELSKAGVKILNVTDELSREIILDNHSVNNLPLGCYILTGFNLTRADESANSYNIDLRLVCVGESDSEILWGKTGYFLKEPERYYKEKPAACLKDVAYEIATTLVNHHQKQQPLVEA